MSAEEQLLTFGLILFGLLALTFLTMILVNMEND
jgi:hypothetical protein